MQGQIPYGLTIYSFLLSLPFSSGLSILYHAIYLRDRLSLDWHQFITWPPLPLIVVNTSRGSSRAKSLMVSQSILFSSRYITLSIWEIDYLSTGISASPDIPYLWSWLIHLGGLVEYCKQVLTPPSRQMDRARKSDSNYFEVLCETTDYIASLIAVADCHVCFNNTVITALKCWLVEQGLTSHSTQFRSFRRNATHLTVSTSE